MCLRRGQTNQGLGDVLGADARPPRSGGRQSRAPRLLANDCGPYPSSSPPGSVLGVGMAPILPGLSDRPEQLAEVVKAVRAAGATSVWANLLYLRPGRRSTSSKHSPRTGPRSSSGTSSSMREAPISPTQRPSRCAAGSAISPGSTVSATAARQARAAAGARPALAARLRADMRHTLPANARRDHVPDRR